YGEQDVQQVARMLTGVGINTGAAPHLRREWQGLYVRHGAFEFNPARHDFGVKMLLGQRIDAEGFAEVERAVTLIVRRPACAHFISRELATYFAGDTPPTELIDAMAGDRKSTRLNSSHVSISYAVFCLKKKKKKIKHKS